MKFSKLGVGNRDQPKGEIPEKSTSGFSIFTDFRLSDAFFKIILDDKKSREANFTFHPFRFTIRNCRQNFTFFNIFTIRLPTAGCRLPIRDHCTFPKSGQFMGWDWGRIFDHPTLIFVFSSSIDFCQFRQNFCRLAKYFSRAEKSGGHFFEITTLSNCWKWERLVLNENGISFFGKFHFYHFPVLSKV
ncbi:MULTISPECIES: hypothetical protein [Niastella]|uniref:Uncharacterized protein n=1 Tax=Niastella soli TaxID=2821487 RepID=A0ABS3YXN6_9BACT|nr:hypothetical protein [Niastella soli]MBO9202681.1 hypothetical protein [Niastella soli]